MSASLASSDGHAHLRVCAHTRVASKVQRRPKPLSSTCWRRRLNGRWRSMAQTVREVTLGGHARRPPPPHHAKGARSEPGAACTCWQREHRWRGTSSPLSYALSKLCACLPALASRSRLASGLPGGSVCTASRRRVRSVSVGGKAPCIPSLHRGVCDPGCGSRRAPSGLLERARANRTGADANRDDVEREFSEAATRQC